LRKIGALCRMENGAQDGEQRAELLDAVLNALDECFAVLDSNGHLVAWNPAAAAVTGYQRGDLLGRRLTDNFYELDAGLKNDSDQARISDGERHVPVKLRHRLGHTLPAMLRRMPLRDALGRRFGTLLRFHTTEEVDALPHGVTEENDLDHHVEHSQAEMEERLDEAWREWSTGGVPFGLLWITIDQAEMLRKTHGRDASEAMLAIVERTLAHALRPAEILGRWGSHEFLVLCHERTAEMLLLHARHVVELAHGADFRWWGDRVSLTVSIGAVQAQAARTGESHRLSTLLQRAQRGMQTAQLAGGDTVILQHIDENSAESEGQACSRS
jgi:diguanylate cyclase (GGDEF)-like protein/PAS domain S-box-containing protein